jgi:hypothetical protein
MERQYNNGEFEKLLRENANQYRMYPSEKVWKGIHSALHTRRIWYGFTTLLLLLTASVVFLIVFNNSTDKKSISSAENNTRLTPSITQHEMTGVIRQAEETSAPVSGNKNSLPRPETVSIASLNAQADETLIKNNLTTEPGEAVENTDDGNYPVDTEQSTLNLAAYDSKSPLTIEATVPDAVIKTSLAGQSVVDEETQKKITETLLALASQNAPVIIPKKQARFTAQVYFTPSISYRKLTENKNSNGYGAFSYSQYIDVNNVVTHKPAMGLELGIEGRYSVNHRFSLKTGFQFNINRYGIRAYTHPTEIATVAISSGYYTDSLAALTNYRNFNGNTPNWLENFYFQVAFPVGAEIILAEKKNITWGISGTVQPTYVIGDRAYLISSDYKNYAKFPDLMRRWNISTGIGTFVSYSTGRIKWQAGPHLRYQHLSSFVSGYPVKENLFAIGLKVGATLNKKQ